MSVNTRHVLEHGWKHTVFICPSVCGAVRVCHYGQTLNCERQFVVLIPLAAPRPTYARRTASAIFVLEQSLENLRCESRGRKKRHECENTCPKQPPRRDHFCQAVPYFLAPMCKCTARPTVQGCTCARLLLVSLAEKVC
jgi:hypothetical protein